MVGQTLMSYFPTQVSYKRFLTLIPRCTELLFLFLKWQCSCSVRTQTYFIDSKKLPVCHNLRIPSNQVFKGFARRGKSSMGWFYGFKVHLIINNRGELMNFKIAPGNVADNNHEMLRYLSDNLTGTCYGDKGYISKITGELMEKGFRLITKARNNMKDKIMLFEDRIKLKSRAIIESVNDLLMTQSDIDHTRHRSPINAYCHMLSALINYNFRDEKPMVLIPGMLN